MKASGYWPWSNIKNHLNGKDDILVKTEAVSRIFGGSFRKILTMDIDECEMETLRKHEHTGRPLGDVNLFKKIIGSGGKSQSWSGGGFFDSGNIGGSEGSGDTGDC